jgi:hypothetical protein
MSSPFDNIWESYRKYLDQLRNIWSDWLRTNGTWVVPVSGVVTEIVAESVKFWIPRWIAQDYEKTRYPG